MTAKAQGKFTTRIRAQGRDISVIRAQGKIVWTRSQLSDLFDRDDELFLANGWVVDYKTPNSAYEIGIQSQAARFAMPDGLISSPTKECSMRYTNALSPSGDGYLETQIAHKGSYDHSTRLFRRGSNFGNLSGIGFDFRSSQASICKRNGGTNTLVLALGAFVVGDIFLMRSVGNLHSCWKNGEFVGEFNDTVSPIPNTSSQRSLLMRMEGSKDFLGPRRFSPALNYVRAS